MQFVYGADWPGLNSGSGSSSMSPAILSRLGLGLRGLYQDLTEEPVPEFLSLLIHQLEQREQRASR
jgi:anti-sigma factor NepR-like protein